MIKKLSMRESTQFDQEYFDGLEEEKGGAKDSSEQ